MYYIETGRYPMSVTPAGSNGGWEFSNSPYDNRAFIQDLAAFIGRPMPLDPINKGAYHYEYIYLSGYTFSANGCKITEPFYVIRVKFESTRNTLLPAGASAGTCGGAVAWTSAGDVRYISPPQAKR